MTSKVILDNVSIFDLSSNNNTISLKLKLKSAKTMFLTLLLSLQRLFN